MSSQGAGGPMRRAALCAVMIACGGSSGSAQLPVGGSYPTTVALLPGGSCSGVTTQNNTTAVSHSPGAGSLTLTHAGRAYAGSPTSTGAFTEPQTPRLASSLT